MEGEEENREKSEGVGIGELLKGYCRGGQASEMTEIGLKDSKERSGERTLYLKHRNTESC